jgi:hypothetical protein
MANYDIADHWHDLSPSQRANVINTMSIAQIEKWASDPDCNQKFICVTALAKHNTDTTELAEVPFRPRTEVSADAQYIAERIIKHLWIIFVLLPVVLGIIFEILK